MTEWTTGAQGDATGAGDAPRRRRWPLVVIAAVLLAVLGSAGAMAGATVSYADSLDGRLLPGTVVAGIDVGTLTQAEALRAVRSAMAEDLDREVVVRWRDRRWTTTARRLGARTDIRDVIADVATSQQGLTWQQWAQMRWLGHRADVSADVTVARDARSVRRFAAAIARQVDQAPRNADVAVVKGELQLTPAQRGHKVVQRRLARRVSAAVDQGRRRVALPVRTLKPEVRDKAFAQVLYLDQSAHRLTLFLDGRKHRTWTVATGTGDYPTPLGRYEVSLKRYLPTWVNPDPTGWGADMPASIPPGPGNPLGLRALNWSAPGAIRFHGTEAIRSLGTSASHGCVRMSNADVVELYDLIDVGAVILSEV